MAKDKNAINKATAETGVQVMGIADEIYVHSVPTWLELNSNTTLEEYKQTFPEMPLYSEAYQKMLESKRKKAGVKMGMVETAEIKKFPAGDTKVSFDKTFSLGGVKATKNARGEDVMCTRLGDPTPEYADFVPEFDNDYVFPIDQLKATMVAAELNKPMLLWGPHGTGKTTLIEQFCAGTNRPMIRVQHTVSTEESHVLGHYVVKDGGTVFEPGPLPIAMRDGLVYVADEYDFALPSVTSVYQPVLEGKPLVIKEAPPEWRFVKPHPNFRFYATGNTNGGGDETGLYAGTQIMNAANYSRFGVTIRMEYMAGDIEKEIVARKAKIHAEDAKKVVDFAAEVRREFMTGKLSATISPRELINAAQLGRVFGTEPDLRLGMQLAYMNRLSSTDKKAVEAFAQRIFG